MPKKQPGKYTMSKRALAKLKENGNTRTVNPGRRRKFKNVDGTKFTLPGRDEYPEDSRRFLEVLQVWIEHHEREPTWADVLQIFKSLGYRKC